VLERAVTFTDLFNFRDLGGYRTADARTVAWRRLFRADDLGRLAGDDRDRFLALGIRTVVDLRRPEEVAELGRMPELIGVTYHHLYLVHPRWGQQEFVDLDDRTDFLTARYSEMAAAGGEAIGDALRLIADAGSAPLVVHCIAGKDRTGMVSALTLSLLGVDDATIGADYALSEVSEAAFRTSRGEPSRPYMVAPARAMIDFLEGLRAGYGSIEAYAKSVGVTADHLAAMRAHLLA
jgi:protein tyrosine/serine phosphatase